jgi:hypothetical protein
VKLQTSLNTGVRTYDLVDATVGMEGLFFGVTSE